MDKVITTALLLVIGMVLAILLFNAAYPAVVQGGDAIAGMAYRAEERLRTDITIIHSAGELNSEGWWQDVNANGTFDVLLWVKNIGTARIGGLEALDIFFGPQGNFNRIPHQSQAVGLPYWNYAIENGTDWDPTTTLRVTLHFPAALTSGRYFAKVTVPSGITAEYYLGF